MNPPRDSLDRDIGRHDEAIDTLKADVAAIRADLDVIKELLSQAKGGWRAMMAVAGLSSALTASVAWVLSHFHIK